MLRDFYVGKFRVVWKCCDYIGTTVNKVSYDQNGVITVSIHSKYCYYSRYKWVSGEKRDNWISTF